MASGFVALRDKLDTHAFPFPRTPILYRIIGLRLFIVDLHDARSDVFSSVLSLSVTHTHTDTHRCKVKKVEGSSVTVKMMEPPTKMLLLKPRNLELSF